MLALAAGCGGGDSPALTVDAASSLQPAFVQIIEAFMNEPGTNRTGLEIELNAAGSATLATAIIEGSRSDVFASADQETMDRIINADRASNPTIFARNRLALVVPADDPARLGAASSTELSVQLSAALVAQCSPQVPCGRLANEAQKALRLSIEPATEETNVRSVLSKVEAGEVDAGFVYFTDAVASDVALIALEGLETFVNDYPVVALNEAPNPRVANEFVEFVLSPPGQAILAEWGFVLP